MHVSLSVFVASKNTNILGKNIFPRLNQVDFLP